MEVLLKLNTDEMRDKLAYPLLATTRYSRVWRTHRCQELYRYFFHSPEQAKAEKIFRLCDNWYVHGAPGSITLSVDDFGFWMRLIEFCRSV